jgi:hypothetical protein
MGVVYTVNRATMQIAGLLPLLSGLLIEER